MDTVTRVQILEEAFTYCKYPMESYASKYYSSNFEFIVEQTMLFNVTTYLREGKFWIQTCYTNKSGDHIRTPISEKLNS